MRTLKVYLAGPYQHKDFIKLRANELASSDIRIHVISRWLDETHPPTTQLPDVTENEKMYYAFRDMEDVLRADILVLFTDTTKSILRAGRHVEFGMALAIGDIQRPMPIFVVGEERENIFHYLPQIVHGTWEQTKEHLLLLAKIGFLA